MFLAHFRLCASVKNEEAVAKRLRQLPLTFAKAKKRGNLLAHGPVSWLIRVEWIQWQDYKMYRRHMYYMQYRVLFCDGINNNSLTAGATFVWSLQGPSIKRPSCLLCALDRESKQMGVVVDGLNPSTVDGASGSSYTTPQIRVYTNPEYPFLKARLGPTRFL